MKCPDEINQHLMNILKIGVLNIRSLIAKEQYGLCSIEANHIHNIPALIQDYSPELLIFYLDVEAQQYLREMEGNVNSEFKVSLNSLQKLRDNK